MITLVQSYLFVNKLHVKMKKSRYMHFKPKCKNIEFSSNHFVNNVIKMKDHEIREVVIIDNQLKWLSHPKNLSKKLRCCSGQWSAKSHNVPKAMHKSLYHTLYYLKVILAMVLLFGEESPILISILSSQHKSTACVLCLAIKMFIQKNKTKKLPELDLLTYKNLGQIFTYLSTPIELLNVHNYHSILSIGKILKLYTPTALN